MATWAIATAALTTIALLALLPMDDVVRGLLICGLVAWGADRIHVIGRCRGPRSVREITLTGDRIVVVRTGNDRLRAGHLRASSYVAACLTTIVWRPDGAARSRTVLILPDMLPANDFRKLRVLMRYGRDASDEAPMRLPS
jgi:hypothetical protein